MESEDEGPGHAGADARTQMVLDVGTAQATVDDHYDVLLDLAATIVGRAIGDLCVIALLSDDGSTLHPVGLHHRDANVHSSLHLADQLSWPSSGGLSEQVLATGEPLVSSPVDLTVLQAGGIWERAFDDNAGTLSLAMVAMRTAGRRIGLLSVAGGSTHAVSAADVPSIQSVADRLALVVDNGHLHEELDRLRAPIREELADPRLGDLSRREREILALIGNGLTNREIAERLFLSVRTIEWHRARLISKVGTTKRATLITLGRALSG
jgi:DNA-binding CsgD family transcriptional regulator